MKVIGWMKSRQNIIFAIIFTVLFMCVILVVQDIKSSAKQLRLHQELQMKEEQLGALIEYSDFMSEANRSLREENMKQAQKLQEAVIILNNQSAVIQKLVEYLKSINEWPPKTDPPKPIDPGKLARNRSEA